MSKIFIALVCVFIACVTLHSVSVEARRPKDVHVDVRDVKMKAKDLNPDGTPQEGSDYEPEVPEVAFKDPHPGFTSDQWAAMKDGENKFEFQAEVGRLMDIIINSLYSNRDIFIRELISNSADALDKIRYESLKDSAVLGDDEESAKLQIKIRADEDAKTLVFFDSGVGMTKDQLINNLGTVAKSGTSEFVAQATGESESDALSLIGQFGVGFYSVYLVAERVTVVSKHNDDEQYVWESAADAEFSIMADPRGNTLGRGTEITLHLREDAEEFLSLSKLEEIVTRYSQFVNFPIFLEKEHTEEEEVELPPDEDDLPGEEPLTEMQKVTTLKYVQVNEIAAIWTRDPSGVEEEEYIDFYKTLGDDDHDPAAHIHFVAEGEITFRSILFAPSRAEAGQYTDSSLSAQNLKLFVRRVLISDEFEDFLPKYMNFIKGVVDSEDLPLNVNRETLAQSRVLRVMSKKLTRKVIEMLKKMADESEEEMMEDEDDEPTLDEDGNPIEKVNRYLNFYHEFGKSLKLGVIDDRSNKGKLSKLLRYQTTKSDGEWISLEDYVDEMPRDQKAIYYISGESVEELQNSPFLEQVHSLGYDVLYFVEPLDEYVVQTLSEFDGIPMMSVSKENMVTGKEDKDLQARLTAKFSPLIEYLTELLTVNKVAISTRLTSSPCIIVTGKYGWSANLERIMKAQHFADKETSKHMISDRTLEINPYHPLINALLDSVAEDDDNDEVRNLAEMMYDAVLVQSGFEIASGEEFASRVFQSIHTAMDVDQDAAPIEHEFDEDADDSDEDVDEHDEL